MHKVWFWYKFSPTKLPKSLPTPPFCHRHNTSLGQFIKRCFKLNTNYHHLEHAYVVWFLSFSSPLASNTHHTKLTLCDLWVFGLLSCIGYPLYNICIVCLVSSLTPLLHLTSTIHNMRYIVKTSNMVTRRINSLIKRNVQAKCDTKELEGVSHPNRLWFGLGLTI